MLHIPTNYSPTQLLESGRRAEYEGKIELAGHTYRHIAENFGAAPEAAEAYAGLVRLGYAQPAVPQAPAPHQWQAGRPAAEVLPRAMPGIAMPEGHHDMQGAWGQPEPDWSNGRALQRFEAPSQLRPPAGRAAMPPPPAPSYDAALHMPVQTIAATFAPVQPPRPEPRPDIRSAARKPSRPQPAPQVSYRAGRTLAGFSIVAGWVLVGVGMLSPVSAALGLTGPDASLPGSMLVGVALAGGGVLALLGAQAAVAVFDQADTMRELVEIERARWED